MANDEVPIADLKARLSEYVTLAKSEGKRILVTKRGKSVAALVGINDYNKLQELQERKSLADIAAKWESFEEIAGEIEEIYRSRHSDDLRNVSL